MRELRCKIEKQTRLFHYFNELIMAIIFLFVFIPWFFLFSFGFFSYSLFLIFSRNELSKFKNRQQN